MSSARLPGKVLRNIAGKPALQYLLESMGQCKELAAMVVATSNDPSDDAIAEFCEKRNVPCHRGPLHDVVERMAQALEGRGLDCFFRVCGDSPLLDHRLLAEALNIYAKDEYDLVTNVLPRTYPAGESVELLRIDSFNKVRSEAMDSEDREHVTRYFYRLAERFRIGRFAAREPWQDARLVLDTIEDLVIIEKIVAGMNRPHWEYAVGDLMRMYPAAIRN
jgi:spore coat polysaccharide biosynthesis protein SpsF (cytidylyltransferase family)